MDSTDSMNLNSSNHIAQSINSSSYLFLFIDLIVVAHLQFKCGKTTFPTFLMYNINKMINVNVKIYRMYTYLQLIIVMKLNLLLNKWLQ